MGAASDGERNAKRMVVRSRLVISSSDLYKATSGRSSWLFTCPSSFRSVSFVFISRGLNARYELLLSVDRSIAIWAARIGLYFLH